MRKIHLSLCTLLLFGSCLSDPIILPEPKVQLTSETQKEGITKSESGNKRISLNFQAIEVKAVLQLLAEFTGINMVISDTVSGNITLSLSDVSCDQALDIILTTQSLGKRRMGNVMFIAPTEEMAKREKKIQQIQFETSNISPLHSELFQINYAKASDIANALQDNKESFLSARGRLAVDIRTNTLWIQESRERLTTIRKIIRQFDVPVRQVLIEARIVNVTKDFAQDLGLRFGLSTPTSFQGGKSPGERFNAINLANRLNFDLGDIPMATSPASIGIALAKLSDNILLDLELSALESEGRGEVISSPRLITTNQQPALIESGEEIPYQEATSSGATAVAFKKAVLSLKVTPQITPDSKILMDLKINQDIPSPKVFNGVPTILTKEIQTNVLVNNGHTIVLGGIYKQDKNNEVNRVPFWGDLPMVGALFRNQSVSTRNEELLIFITPRIISNSLSSKTLSIPKNKLSLGSKMKRFVGKSG